MYAYEYFEINQKCNNFSIYISFISFYHSYLSKILDNSMYDKHF